jgi:hypothetical protein
MNPEHLEKVAPDMPFHYDKKPSETGPYFLYLTGVPGMGDILVN